MLLLIQCALLVIIAQLVIVFRSELDGCAMYDGRCGVVVKILDHYAKGRGFDSRTVQTFVCMNMSACIGYGCFSICMYLQKKVYKYVLIRYLESITQAL
jgi:hypothetical protein